ncbi:hypothetical protein [Nostocoides veronense]|uniref:hypothetical protein n=1 Tax=Nostocoides veronense TaxID=330836 RepID=UPI0031E45887
MGIAKLSPSTAKTTGTTSAPRSRCVVAFADVPVAKTLDDMKRLVNDIMPKVNDAS